jgi:hypothetical protein
VGNNRWLKMYLFLLWILISCCLGSSYSSWGPAKLRQVYIIFKTLHYISQQISQHIKCVPSGHYSTTTYLQHKIHVYVCVQCVCYYVGVYACVCACVSSQSPLSHKVYFYQFFQSDFTACMSYLMWNRGPCMHGSM